MLKESTKLNLYHGVYINQTNPQILTKTVLKYHKRSDIIMVNGGKENINRAACQMPQIDIINEPYISNHNSGINHILSKMLVENNISVNINYRSVLKSRGYYKSKMLSQINQLFSLQDKYGFRTIISSGSQSFYDVKSPDAMLLLGNLFNVKKEIIEKSLTTNVEDVIKNIQIRKDSIVDGVTIIK
jgi:ribonuclease P/MRP protein subunit RPP1